MRNIILIIACLVLFSCKPEKKPVFKLDSTELCLAKLIKTEDMSYSRVNRKGLKYSLPKGLSKEQVNHNIKCSLNKFIKDQSSTVKAIIAFYFRDDEPNTGAYTVARAVFALNGKWADASKFISYRSNKLKIDLVDRYFEVKTIVFAKGKVIKLKAGIDLSNAPGSWDDNIIKTTKSKTKAKIISHKKYPMGNSLLIRYKVKIGKKSGWVHAYDIEG